MNTDEYIVLQQKTGVSAHKDRAKGMITQQGGTEKWESQK